MKIDLYKTLRIACGNPIRSNYLQPSIDIDDVTFYCQISYIYTDLKHKRRDKTQKPSSPLSNLNMHYSVISFYYYISEKKGRFTVYHHYNE
ncbi:hypothetical protein BLOT_002111 [Blomia tropicalis]|nr:hypothetical protein BLOT_002111 [Blomia tropicalis]